MKGEIVIEFGLEGRSRDSLLYLDDDFEQAGGRFRYFRSRVWVWTNVLTLSSCSLRDLNLLLGLIDLDFVLTLPTQVDK